MKRKASKVTRGEQQYLEHVGRARERKQTLAQYCRSVGLKVQSLYNARYQVKRKGAGAQRAVQGSAARSAFIALRVPVTATPTVVGTPSVCRVQHPSGWVIECASWPQAAWIRECVQGGSHGAT